MHSDDESAPIIVRCERCLYRFGKGTMIGAIVVSPGGSGWAWGVLARGSRPDQHGSREYFVAERRAGGIEARCRRCGYRFRSRVARLPGLIARAKLTVDGTRDPILYV